MFTSVLDSSGPPLLESEWTLETGPQVREDLEGGELGWGVCRALAKSGQGVKVGSWGCSLGMEHGPSMFLREADFPAACPRDLRQGTLSTFALLTSQSQRV